MNENETYGGENTMDRIYLLSLNEVAKEEYGFTSYYERWTTNTDYTKCNDAHSSRSGNGIWWLRSPGDYYDRNHASYVDSRGDVYSTNVSVPIYTVRPVLHLNLSSSLWSKVSSDGTEKPVPGESPSADGSPKPDASPDQTVENISSAVPSKPGTVSIKSAKNSKRGAAVLTWKKVNGASGYKIQYTLDQKFVKGRKTKTISRTRCTLKKLKKKKTYYFRIRAYKKTGSKNVYGAWSKVKKVKIKK